MWVLLLLAGLAMGDDATNKETMTQYNSQMFTEYSAPASYVFPADQRSEEVPQQQFDQGVQVAAGPWYTVPNDPYQTSQDPFRTSVDPFGIGGSFGVGFEPQGLVTWGLGAVILLLLISTAVNLFRRVFPDLRSMWEETGEARSLENLSSLAQMVLTAMEKYEQLNMRQDG